MSNLLTLPFKTTQVIPIKNAVRNYIQHEHMETHPDAFKWDLNKWESLRKDAISNVVHVSNIDKVIAYHAQLICIATKLPPDIDLPISYSRPFPPNPNPPMLTMSNLVYERVNILYNLAALYCNLAIAEDRSNGDGIKRSLAYFQNASGVLSYIVSVLPALKEPLPPNSSLPLDLSEAFHTALQYLMLAQAQESFWQRAVIDDVKVALISKLAAKTANYYKRTFELMEDSQISALFSRDWITHVRIKHYHFAAAALYRKSIDDLGGNRYGEEIARLEMAKVEAKKGLEVARRGNAAKSVVDDIRSLSNIVESSLKRAERDNDLIYHQDVPSATSLPAIQDMKDVVFTNTPPGLSDPKVVIGEGDVILGELSGWGVLKAIDIYNTRRNDWLQSEIFQPAKDLDIAAEATLHALNLPASLDALDKPIGLPPSLLAKADQVRHDDAMNRIPSLLDDLQTLSGQNRIALDKALDVLDQEASEDEEMRTAFEGDAWTRPPSYEANTHLTDAAKRYQGILDNLDNTVRELQETWDIWSKSIEPLCWDNEDLERVVPSSTISAGSANGGSRSTQGHARALRSYLEALEDIIQSRAELAKRVQRIANMDDVSGRFKREESSLGRWAEVRPEVFDQAIEAELGKYDKYKEDLEENGRRQDEALHGIKEKNVLFLDSRKDDPSVKARESALQALDLAYHKYRAIYKDIAEGIKLHNDLGTLIAELEDTCKTWVLERRKDVEWLTATLNATSLTAFTEEQDIPKPVVSAKAATSTVARPRQRSDSSSSSNIPPPDSKAWESISPSKAPRNRDSESSRPHSVKKQTKTEISQTYHPNSPSPADDFAFDLPPPNSSAWESISPPLSRPSPSKKKAHKLAR